MNIRPRRRRIDENDPFFDEGNEGRPINMPCLPVVPLLDLKGSMEDDDEASNSIACPYAHCSARFNNVQSYDLHINMTHMYRCSECGMDFVSERLLDMHMSEIHDSYFAVLSKKLASYQCVVEGCPEMFWSNKDRRKHLLSVHNFPWTYDFHEPAKFRRIRKQKVKRDSLKHKAEAAKCKTLMDRNEDTMDIEPHTRKHSHINGGTIENENGGEVSIAQECEEGSKLDKHFTSSESDHVIQDLSASFTKVRLVPDNISFGRRRRPKVKY